MAKISGVYARDDSSGLKYHGIHRSWLNSLDATETVYQEKRHRGLLENSFLELYNGRFTEIDEEADKYIIENARTVYGLKKLRKIKPNAEIIYLATSWKLFGLQPYNLDKEDVHNRLRAVNESLDSFLTRRNIKKYCDRIITISPLYRQKLSEIFPSKNIEIVKPVSKTEINTEPNLSENTAIFVGANRDHKGVDLLVEAWKKVRKEIPDAELILVGEGHKEHDTEGVRTAGYAENLEDEYSKASLYIHPARIDGYAVSVLEAMKAGFPAIVTNQTGAKTEVEKVSKQMIAKPEPEDLADKTIEYLNKNKGEREKLSDRFREKTKDLTYEKSERNFREEVLK